MRRVPGQEFTGGEVIHRRCRFYHLLSKSAATRIFFADHFQSGTQGTHENDFVYQTVPSRGFEPPDLLQTRQVLYQLSYDGAEQKPKKAFAFINNMSLKLIDFVGKQKLNSTQTDLRIS